MSGRFDYRFELESIGRGMDRDLQQPVGQTIPWYVYDKTNSVVDPIYDVGNTPNGRRWKPPQFLSVLSAIKLEGEEIQNDRGFYVVDRLQVVFSAAAAIKNGLDDLIYSPNDHALDRIVYENKVFAIDHVRVRGILKAGYTTCAADCTQVKDEELVNDVTFQAYIQADTSPHGTVSGSFAPTISGDFQ